MDKHKTRIEMINWLKQIHTKDKQQIEKQLYFHLFMSPIWRNAQVIGTTWSQKLEWNTKPIIEQAWKEKKIACIPKSNYETKQMTFYKITAESVLHKGYANILEPSPQEQRIDKHQIDLLIVPGIVFDAFGNRIGFGGGFYDRFLTNFPNNTVAIASKHQLISSIPTEPHDLRVQFMITEDGCLKTDK